MLFPQAAHPLRILIPERLVQMHAPKHKDVWPPISIEIVHVTKHRIRRRWFPGKCLGRIELVLHIEIRPLIPEWPGDNVQLAIAIDVRGCNAVAEVLLRENLLKEGWARALARQDRRISRGAEQPECQHHEA